MADVGAVEFNLNVLYNCTEISLLLERFVRKRDALAKKRRRKQKHLEGESASEFDNTGEAEEEQSVEDRDEFETTTGNEIDLDALKVGSAGIQDLLMVIQKADLQDALPHVVLLLELAVVIPLTSVHCERVFSRMKRVVAPERSRMLQSRKNHLVLLQVEHKLLRWLADKPDFHENVVMRFKMRNRRRLERFSKK